MCGRFTMSIDADDVRTQLALGQMPIDWKARYNIAPSQEVATVPDPTNRDVVMMRWGLVPYWAKDPSIGFKTINARAETLLEKPSYKHSFQHKRCLILADGFYEWLQVGKTRQPFFFSLADGAAFAFAGLWDDWEPQGVSSMPGIPGITSCTIITTEANAVVAQVHPRMPVILTGDATYAWLESENKSELLSLLNPLDPQLLRGWAVGRAVNSSVPEGPELVEPIKTLL